ncbi:hypothetical protein O3M35_002584 [Rhynocoris fuscipes]|uniref:Uncharacterized protein n=1 Tax=Rhynocoris fuscipes TaxID=488301 RepID=A0AAW1CRU1_9HEMI
MTELQRKMCFMHQVKWHPCLADGAQKLIKAKLSNIRREYKKIFKLAKAVLEIWWTQNLQLCATLLAILLVRFIRNVDIICSSRVCTECKKLHQNICNSC